MTENTPETTATSKGGAPKGNRNRMSHGLRAGDRNGAGLGTLPKGCGYIRKEAGKFQRALESELLADSGKLSTYQLGRCQTAATNRMFAATALKWLRDEAVRDASGGQLLPLTDRVGVLTKISALLEASDRAMRELGLDRKPDADDWALIDQPAASTWQQHHDGLHETATSGQQESNHEQPQTTKEAKPAPVRPGLADPIETRQGEVAP